MRRWLVQAVIATGTGIAGAQPPLDLCNLVWTTPSADASGSMPIGNGELGANVWFEPSGDLVLLLSRTDSFSEASRLLKLGRVRVSISPNPLADGGAFHQELVLREGRIACTMGRDGRLVSLSIYADPDHDVIHVTGEARAPVSVTVALEAWRTTRHVLKGQELQSSWTMRDAPESMEVWESPDVMVDDPTTPAIGWCHRNASSVVPLTFQRQGIESIAALAPDPLRDRTFGGWITPTNGSFARPDPATLRTTQPTRSFAISIATRTDQSASIDRWLAGVRAASAASANAGEARDRTAAWWGSFWDRSWIFVEGDRPEAIPANAHPLRIGIDSNGENQFKGELGRVAAYARALTPADIGRLARTRPDEPGPSDAAFSAVAPRIGPDPGALQSSPGVALEAWIRPAPDAGGRIFDKLTAGTSDGFLFDMHPGLALRLIVGSATLTAPVRLKPDVWQHVAATYDAPRLAIYLDGALVAESGASPDAAPASRVTQAYILQRWVTACGGRGRYPIKFNGSIFTVEPKFTGGPDFNPDWRRWGDAFWWQNTRLPYAPMPAAGDSDHMASLFGFFRELAPVSRGRAELYYGAKGLYFPETITMFGSYANGDYGWKRDGLAPGDISPCPWWQWAWNQGPELVMLMLDYYDHTGDDRFLRDELIPMARDVMLYFDSRFKRDAAGKLVISPTQSVETYWHDVANDTPTVAGLRAVLPRLLALPSLTDTDRDLYRRLLDATPPLPLRTVDGATFIAPAEKYKDQRSNVENPELYAVFPFRLFGPGSPDLEIARESYRRRVEKSMLGWSYDGQSAAMLGLADEAEKQLLAKVRNSHPKHRFPAMWGPNYDWLPDQCHGGNLMLTLQGMAMHADGDRIDVLPAWPRHWNVDFKLHAPHRTTVECRFRAGRIEHLTVTPPQRAADVHLPPDLRRP